MSDPVGSSDEHLSGWPDPLENAIEDTIIERVMVLEETLSTQDAAARACLGLDRDHRGTLVVAGRQMMGRGQRDHHWYDAHGSTLPCSFALGHDLLKLDNPSIAARAGLATLDAVRVMAPDTPLKIKWPNDIYASTTVGEPGKKLAGVLVEHAQNSIVIGIGINCMQNESDWSPTIKDSAVSLRMLGGRTSRVELACTLIAAFDYWLGLPGQRATDEQVRAHWATHDALTGTTATFIHNNQTTTGSIIEIDPLTRIRLDTKDGEVVLPVAQTTLVESKFS